MALPYTTRSRAMGFVWFDQDLDFRFATGYQQTLTGAINLVSAGSLTISTVVKELAAISMAAGSTLTTSGVRATLAAAPMVAASSLSTTALNTDVAAAPLVAASTLTSTASITEPGAASLTATATLTTSSFVTDVAAVPLVAASTLGSGNLLTGGSVTGSAWVGGGTTITTGVLDPNGGTTAFSVAFPVDGINHYAGPPVPSGEQPYTPYTVTAWIRSSDGSSVPFRWSAEDPGDQGQAGWGYNAFTATGTWTLYTVTGVTGWIPNLRPLVYSFSGEASGKTLQVWQPTISTGVRAVDTALPSVTLTAASTLTSAGVLSRVGAASLTAASTLTSSALVTELPAVPLTAAATLTTSGFATKFAAAPLTAASTLTTSGVLSRIGASSLVAASTFTDTALVTDVASIALIGRSRLYSVSAYASRVLASNPIAYWRMSDSNGATTVVATVGPNGATSPASSFTSAQGAPIEANSKGFDTVGGTISGSFGSLTTSTGSWSLEGWCKWTGPVSYYDSILALGGTDGNLLQIDSDPSGILRARLDTSLINQVVSTSIQVKDGLWHHLALTYNVSNRAAILYADGVQVGSITVSGTAIPTTYSGKFGAVPVGGPWAGVLDELAVYDRVLTPAEITARLDPLVTQPAAAAMTATATLSAPARVTEIAAVSLSSASTLTTAGTLTRLGAMPLAAAANMTVVAQILPGSQLSAVGSLTINALVATVHPTPVGPAITALPNPPTAWMSVSSASAMTTAATIHVTAFHSSISTSSWVWHTVLSGPVFLAGTSTTTVVPTVTIRSVTSLYGSSTMVTNGNLVQSHTSTDGGFSVQGFGSLTVDTGTVVLPSRITIKNLMSVTPTMQAPVIINGQPVLPSFVGQSTSAMTTAGTYTISSAPSPSSSANVMPVAPVWRWLAADVPGQQGESVLQWPEHTGSGPSFTSNDAFAPTVADLIHYDTSTKSDINMGRVMNFYWRYAQHMGLVMDGPHRMSTPQPFTIQFVLMAHAMTSNQYQHIWDSGTLVADGYYTDPTSRTVELISDAVYQNKVVPISDDTSGRAYFGLRPTAVETLYNNTPHVAQLSTTTIVSSRPLVYTCIFNAGAASRIRIRGYGVNETLAADHKTSVVNDFILGRAQQRIGSTAGAYMNVWEILYYNRVLSEDELGMNSHWLGGVYKFSTFK